MLFIAFYILIFLFLIFFNKKQAIPELSLICQKDPNEMVQQTVYSMGCILLAGKRKITSI